MARDYGRVHTAFWNSADMRGLDDRGKLLANYLLTGPHSNSIGAYLLPDAYIADDLGWTMAAVRDTLGALIKQGFCQRFADGRHVAICKFLEWNPIENPNVGKAALRQLDHLPADHAVEHVLKGLEACSKQFPNGFGTSFERFRNTKPETKPEPETDPETDSLVSAVADEPTVALQAYNVVAREVGWPEAQRLTEARKSKILRRLAECGGTAGWREAMAKARASPFLRGESGRDKAHAKWVPDLDFFLQQESFTKLMEGKYDDRANTQEPTGFAAILAGASAAAAQ